MSSRHNQPDAEICRMSPEKPYGNTTPQSSLLERRKGEKCTSGVLPIYCLSVVKFTLQGINFLYVQVVVCSPSRQPLGQSEPLACRVAVTSCHLGLNVGAFSIQWQWLRLKHCGYISDS